MIPFRFKISTIYSSLVTYHGLDELLLNLPDIFLHLLTLCQLLVALLSRPWKRSLTLQSEQGADSGLYRRKEKWTDIYEIKTIHKVHYIDEWFCEQFLGSGGAVPIITLARNFNVGTFNDWECIGITLQVIETAPSSPSRYDRKSSSVSYEKQVKSCTLSGPLWTENGWIH